jgi:tRNA nucleotidyltransferase (CCA-adding enzyme)
MNPLHNLGNIFEAIRLAGGRPLIVGGWVRDLILGRQSKDIDVEVYGLDVDVLSSVLAQFGDVDTVGASFGVLKVHGLDVDFSLPRRENKEGRGHKGFIVSPDPDMTVEEAAARRDFTFNALAWDDETNSLIDPFQGEADLRDHILRHTSSHFGEDPLRVLRGFQFCGRFDLRPAWETVEVCRSLAVEFDTLPRERIWEEWWKWASRSVRPSAGLWFLRVTWATLFPALAGILHTTQDLTFHPEGGVWEHTCLAVDVAASIADRETLSAEDRAVLVFAALLHDVGKAETTQIVDGHIVSPGHAEASVSLGAEFLVQIGAPAWLIGRVLPLVQEHMAHLSAHTFRAVRRLALRLAPSTLRELCWVIEADHSARPPLPGGLPAEAARLLEIGALEHITDSRPAPLVMGRHLLPLGWLPGLALGRVLAAAFEAQLDGAFYTVEDGVAWVQATF